MANKRKSKAAQKPSNSIKQHKSDYQKRTANESKKRKVKRKKQKGLLTNHLAVNMVSQPWNGSKRHKINMTTNIMTRT